MGIVSSFLRHHLIDCVGLRKLLWQAGSLALVGEAGEADAFRYKRRALIYERLAIVVDTELLPRQLSRQLGSRCQRSHG